MPLNPRELSRRLQKLRKSLKNFPRRRGAKFSRSRAGRDP